MAVPKRKSSKARGRKRRTHYKLETPNLVRCPQCHTLKAQHQVCKECGTYKGKEVVAQVAE
ncbi:MAG: 50S ribosomal protein L32 [Clostridia bacterium]|nr:50S ribosomal protein L32 [Clostridia bacterium]